MKSTPVSRRSFGLKHIVLIVVVFIVFVGMAGFGLSQYSGIFGGGDSAVTVGSEEVPLQIFTAEYNMALQQNASLLAKNPYMSQSILENMISKNVSSLMFVNEANKLHIGISDDLIYQIIAKTPYFNGPDGKFSEQQFNAAVSQVYGSQKAYINVLRKDLKQSQLTGSIVNSIYVPNIVNDYALNSLAQTRVVTYVTLAHKDVKNLGSPTDKELTNLLNSSKDIYTQPEFRALQIVEVDSTNYLTGVKITDKEISDYYNKNKANYMNSSARDFSEISVPTADAANKLYAKLKDAKSLNGAGVAITSFNKVTKDTLPEDVVGTIFSVPLNVVQKPVKTPTGYKLIIVTAEYAPQPKPLSAVSKSIKIALAGNQMSEVYNKLKTDLSNAAKSGQPLTTIAKNFKYAKYVMTNNVNIHGFNEKNEALTGPATNQDVLNSAFTLPLNQVSDVITSQGKFYIVKVVKIIPAHLQTLNEARTVLTHQWAFNKADAIVKAEAQKVVANYSKNKTLKGYKLNTITISRQKTIKSYPFNSFSMDQLFLSHLNTPIEGAFDNGDIFVAVVAKINNPIPHFNDKDSYQIKQYITSLYKQDILTSIFNVLNTKYTVKVNEKGLLESLGNSNSDSSPQQ